MAKSKKKSVPAAGSKSNKPRKAKRRPSREDRHRMIAEAAYFKAESRDFSGGNPDQDWLEAEAEIDRIIAVSLDRGPVTRPRARQRD